MFRLERYLCLLLMAGIALVCVSFSAKAAAQGPSPNSQQALASLQPAEFSPMEIGDSLIAHRRYEEAIATYRKSPEMTAEIWNKMGIAYQLMVNFQQAARCYKESLKLNPSDPRVLNNLATLYESEKDYDHADSLYQKALRIDPRSALIYKNLGTNLIAEHKYDLGRNAYEQAVALDPEIFAGSNNPTVDNPASAHERGAMNYYMALACAHTGQANRAVDYLRASLDEGFADADKLAEDRGFASMSGDPGFQKLLAEQRSQ